MYSILRLIDIGKLAFLFLSERMANHTRAELEELEVMYIVL
jgi:hypothetical protein